LSDRKGKTYIKEGSVDYGRKWYVMAAVAMGLLWTSRVLMHGETVPPEGATAASAVAQVVGLHDTFVVVMTFLAFGLFLSVLGLVQERRLRRAAVLEANP
jgi:hypothetical protein